MTSGRGAADRWNALRAAGGASAARAASPRHHTVALSITIPPEMIALVERIEAIDAELDAIPRVGRTCRVGRGGTPCREHRVPLVTWREFAPMPEKRRFEAQNLGSRAHKRAWVRGS